MGLKLNVGSGQRPFGKGWTDVDRKRSNNPEVYPDPDVIADGSHMPMFDNDSAEYIVLFQVLEHFGCGESSKLLAECRRILSPQGSLLVFVPDMWELVSMWREGRLSTQVFMTNVYGAYMGDEADRHKWGFDFISLKALLVSNGFQVVMPFHWISLPGADIARGSWILGVEAMK